MNSDKTRKKAETFVGVTLDLFGFQGLSVYRMHVLWKDGKVSDFYFPGKETDNPLLKLSHERIGMAFCEAFPNRDIDDDVESWTVGIHTRSKEESGRGIPSAEETIRRETEESTIGNFTKIFPYAPPQTIDPIRQASARKEGVDLLSSNRILKKTLANRLATTSGVSMETARRLLNITDEEGG